MPIYNIGSFRAQESYARNRAKVSLVVSMVLAGSGGYMLGDGVIPALGGLSIVSAIITASDVVFQRRRTHDLADKIAEIESRITEIKSSQLRE